MLSMTCTPGSAEHILDLIEPELYRGVLVQPVVDTGRGRVVHDLYPETNRPYRVPGGMEGAWAAAIITEAFVVITAVARCHQRAVRPVLLGRGDLGVSRAFFEWVTLGAFGAMVLLGVAFWAIGARNVRRGLLAPATEGEEEPR
jgi:hypothetical protein